MVPKRDAEFEGAISILCNKPELENEQTRNKALNSKILKRENSTTFL